ncbi:class I SAM-dependent methyltransferase [Parafrankia elaeagni]|uniref:class I SAM-dependent methyltransferase n=1 Tax=Parafrankia elaeagni TaxID=222534 RepID=UPI0009FCB00B
MVSIMARLRAPQHRWGLDVLDRISGTPITRVLDAGCGSGRVTEALLERFPDAEVVAVDSSDSMLAAAAKKRTETAAVPTRAAVGIPRRNRPGLGGSVVSVTPRIKVQ